MSAIKLAFLNEINLILLGGSGLLSLAFLSPWPVLVALAGEALYLTIGARGRLFDRYLERQRQKQRLVRRATQAEQEERELEPAYLGRIELLVRQVAELRAAALERGLDPAVFDRGQRLEALVRAFRRMSVLHQRLGRMAAQVPVSRIQGEIQRLEQATANERDAEARFSLGQALALQQRRLTQHGRSEGRRRALEIKMSTIETSLEYTKTQLAAGGGEAEVGEELEQVLQSSTTGPGLETAAEDALGPQAPPPRQTVIGLGGES